jgi:hypothetical protein
MSDVVTNPNFLSPLNFKFILKRAPHINFFIQKVNIPGVALPPINVGNPNLRVPYPDAHLLYDELTIFYRVDEDLKNYMELHQWIRSLGKRSFGEYKELQERPNIFGESLYSDISLTILTSKRNANYEVVFQDSFPINVSGMNFTTTDTNVSYIEASATFRYTLYEITKV